VYLYKQKEEKEWKQEKKMKRNRKRNEKPIGRIIIHRNMTLLYFSFGCVYNN